MRAPHLASCPYLVCAIVMLLAAMPASAQRHRLVPLDHWAYEYIHRLQLRGYLLDLHPTALPYTTGEIASAASRVDGGALAPAARRWVRRLRDEFGGTPVRGKTIGGAELQPGIRLSTTPRLDALRPAEHDATLEAGPVSLFPQAAGRLFLERGPVVAQAGLRFDLYYRDDPDALDAANRLITRNEDAYAGVDTRYASAYVGRFRQHWAPPGETALLVSMNPVGMDQLHLRIGGDRLALRSVVGELDSMTEDGRFTGVAGSDSVDASVRRYVAAHRFDWRPSRGVAVSLMESTVYSGRSSGFSLKFLNPLVLHAFAVDGRPKNDENNGLLAGILWAQHRAWTLHGQLLIDDVDLMRASGEPASLALSGSLVFAGLDRTDIGAALTAVASRTYNAHQPDGRYTHLLRGIGAPYNDFVHVSAYATFYLGRDALDVSLTPRLDALYQGAARIHQPYPTAADEVNFILHGTVEKVVRPALQLRLQHGRRWWFQVDAGPAYIANERHAPSSDRTAFTATAALVARLSAADPIGLSF